MLRLGGSDKPVFLQPRWGLGNVWAESAALTKPVERIFIRVPDLRECMVGRRDNSEAG